MGNDNLDTPIDDSPNAPPPASPAVPDEVDAALQEGLKRNPPIDEKGSPPANDSQQPPPPPPPGPAPASSNDVTDAATEHVQQTQDDAAFKEGMDRNGGSEPAPVSTDEGAAPTPTLNPDNPIGAVPVTGEKAKVKNIAPVALDLIHGSAEIPFAVTNGVRNAFQAMGNDIGDIGQVLRKALPKAGIFQGGVEFNPKWLALGPVGAAAVASDLILGTNVTGAKSLGEDEWAALKAKNGPGIFELPGTPGQKTVTGKLISGMAQWATGFWAAGALGGGGALSGVRQSLTAGYLAFEGHQENLANLVEEHPQLLKPVTEFFKMAPIDLGKMGNLLATHPDDSEQLGRFKNGLVEAGLGAGMEGLSKLFTAGLKGIQSGTALDALARKFGTDYAGESFEPRPVAPYETGVLVPNGEAPENWAKYFTEDGARDWLGKLQERGRDLHLKELGKLPEPALPATELPAATRGIRPNEVTWEASKGINAGQLIMDWKPGTSYNAEEALAISHVYRGTEEAVNEAAPLAASVPTDANTLALLQRNALHTQTMNAMDGAGAEMGRGLQIFNLGLGRGETADQLARMVKEQGPGSLDLANNIVKLQKSVNQEAVNALVRTATKFGDAISNTIVQGLLGPPTVAVKASSDYVNALMQISNRAVAARISEALGTEGGVHLSEALMGLHTTATTTWESFVALSKNMLGSKSVSELLATPESTLKQMREKYGIPFSAMEQPPGQGGENLFSASLWGRKAGEDASTFGKVLDIMDQGTRTPGRLIGEIHNFSWMMNYRSEVTMQACRQASQELEQGAIAAGDLKSRIAEIAGDIPDGIHQQAKNYADYATFTQDPAPALKRIGNALQQFPVLGRIFLPFKVIPSNIMTESLEMTPMAPFIGSWRADLMAGGARGDIAMAKLSTGTTILQMAMDMGFRGMITGKAPTDHFGRADFEAMKKQEYSLKIPGTENGYISFERLGSIGFVLGLGADMAQACVNMSEHAETKALEKVVAAGAFSIGGNVLHKTYMMSLSQLVAALNEPDQRADKFLQHMAAMTVPSSVATGARLADPQARATDSMMDAVLRKLPYFSKGLPPDRDRWGDPRNYRSPVGWAYDAFSPYWVKSQNPEPIDKELDEIHYAPDMVGNKVKVGDGVTKPQMMALDTKQLSRYKELAGNGFKDPLRGNMGAKDFLNSVVTGNNPEYSPVYDMLRKQDAENPTEGRKQFIQKTIRSYREQAARQMFQEDGKLQTDYKAKSIDPRRPSVQLRQQ